MRKVIDVSPFEELFTVEVEPELLAERLHNVPHRYARLALLDAERTGGQIDEAGDLVYLELLREYIKKVCAL
jgi:hypothetical protein